jgi:hypothetical protein
MDNETKIVIGVTVGVAIGILVAIFAFIIARFYRKRTNVQQSLRELSSPSLPIRTNGVNASVDSSVSLSVSESVHDLEYSPKKNTFWGGRRQQDRDLFSSMSGIPRYSYKYVYNYFV